MEVEDHVEFDFAKLSDEFEEIASFPTLLIPDPDLSYGRKALNHRFIAFSQEEMDLGIRVLVFDGTSKMASEDGIPNEGRLDDKNFFRRSIIHTIRLAYYYGKNHSDYPHF
jgi:hypothetical protein